MSNSVGWLRMLHFPAPSLMLCTAAADIFPMRIPLSRRPPRSASDDKSGAAAASKCINGWAWKAAAQPSTTLAEVRLTRLRARLRNEGIGLAVGARGGQGWLGGLPAGWAEVVARGLGTLHQKGHKKRAGEAGEKARSQGWHSPRIGLGPPPVGGLASPGVARPVFVPK